MRRTERQKGQRCATRRKHEDCARSLTGVAELKHGIRAAVEGARGRLGPAHRAAVLEERVLLLDAVPGVLVEGLVEDGLGHGPGRLLDGGHVRAKHLAQHKDVVALAHRVLAHEGRLEEHLRVIAGGLPRQQGFSVGARASLAFSELHSCFS